MKEYEDAYLRYEAELAAWKRKGHKDGNEPPQKPEKPVARRNLCSDVTVEALASILDTNPRGVLLARDELAGWLGSFDTYRKRGSAKDAAHWLEMHRAGQIIVDRKTGDKKTLHVPRAAVSLTGNIQPAVLARVLGREHFENGLAARMLVTMPPRTPHVWSDAQIARNTRRAMTTLFDGLYALEYTVDRDGELVPVDLPLMPQAKAEWVLFYNDHGREQARLTGDLAAAWSKLEGYAARLALVLHCVRQVTRDPTLAEPDAIDKRDITAGIELARWFEGEAVRVYRILNESEDNREARELVEFIRARGGSITVRELQRARGGQYGKAEAAHEALERLANLDLGRWVQPDSSPKGGRPSQVFQLTDNDKTDKTPGSDGVLSVLSVSGTEEPGNAEGGIIIL